MKQNNFKFIWFLLLFFGCLSSKAQQVYGVVYNKETKEPMEGVTVYFDGTTRGTITNSEGAFKIEINKDIQTSLVVSFLGFGKIVQEDYYENKIYEFYLKEEMSVLNEVFLSSRKASAKNKNTQTTEEKDSWSNKRKLNEFKRHFLGASKQAQSCEILNEEDLIIEFDKASRKLLAYSEKPIRILNNRLEYEIAYDLQEFEIQYVKDTLVNTIRKTTSYFYRPTTIFYEGTSFYKDIVNENPSEKIDKRRDEVYLGSVLHFMRAIYSDSLREQGFKFMYNNQQVLPEYSLIVNKTEDPNLKEVCLLKTVVVSDAFNSCSTLIPNEEQECFYVDNFGNHSPIKAITFSGFMGDQRVGDALPLDYKLKAETVSYKD